MINVENLTKSFGAVTAVAGLDLEIRRGETFGLLGPNGAGKSTTIRCLIGALPADRGRIDIDGKGPPNDPGVRRRIGVAPQELAIYGELTAEENLRFFGRLYGLRGRALADRVESCLELAALVDRRHDRVADYSGGMKRRLNLACALVHGPRVLFLDEPTAGVDPQSRNHIFDSIERLERDGVTILYTTHYMEEAQRLCDRVAIIDLGRVLALDAVDVLVERHGGRSTITLELDGDPPEGVTLPAEPDGSVLSFETDEPIAELQRLADDGVAFRSLHVDRPDLESVFLELTGRRLRD